MSGWEEFNDSVLHARVGPCKGCPFRQTANGMYPKFGYGDRNSRFMAVFQNPGVPREKSKEGHYNIDSIDMDAMRRLSRYYIEVWFRQCHFNVSEARILDKPFLDACYITQAYRCPNPPGMNGRQAREARTRCLENLRVEVGLVRPLAIMVFGEEARKSVAQLYGATSEIAKGKITADCLERKVFLWGEPAVRVRPWPLPTYLAKVKPAVRAEYKEVFRWDCSELEQLSQ